MHLPLFIGTILSLVHHVPNLLTILPLAIGVATFTNSQQFLQYLQANYGSANFAQWQSIRQQFYCFVNYPAAGASQLSFFGFATGGTAAQNAQYTNMPKAGSFGQQFLLLKSVQTGYYVSNKQNMIAAPLSTGTAVDTNVPSADFLYGLFQAGCLEINIGNKPYVQVAQPFLYCPPADGETVDVSAFGLSGVLAAGSPPTISTLDTLVAHADLNRNRMNRYLVDPNILMESEQQFSCTISYPSGVIPIISSGIYTNNLYVGVIFDGILFRPVQ